jgi:hypothetical protein
MLVSLLLLAPGSAYAQAMNVDELVAGAHKALVADDRPAALELLDWAEEAAPNADLVVLDRTLASIPFYRGVIAHREGDVDGAMGLWRAALVQAPHYAPDTQLLDDDALDLVEALRSEIRQRPELPVGVRDDSDVRVFVSGRLMQSYDLVYKGTHLVQVMCPDQSLHGQWVAFGEPQDWYAQCGEAPLILEPQVVDAPVEAAGPGLDPVALALVGAGAGLVAGGVGLTIAVVAPAHDQVVAARDNPASVTRTQADARSAQYNSARWATVGVLTVGAAAATAGGVRLATGERLSVAWAGPGVTLSGSF